MVQRIREYVDNLFEGAPNTKQARDLREEICSNLMDKYVDLTANGMSEEDAYATAIAGVGDVEELIRQLRISASPMEESTEVRRRSAILVSIAVGLYILSVVPVIALEQVSETIGVVCMFILCAIATMLLIYNSMTKPKYHKLDDTFVEEFKEWKREKESGNSVYNAICGALWLGIVAVYFIISFMFGAWAFSWVIFLIGVAVQQILRAIFILNK